MTAEELAAAYDLYEPDVVGIATNFARRYRLEVYECIGQANLIFINLFQATDLSKGSFAIRLRQLLGRRLIQYFLRGPQRSQGMTKVPRDERLSYYYISTDFVGPAGSEDFDYGDVETAVGGDARTVLSLARDAPMELEQRPSRKGLVRYLRERCGWENSRVLGAFQELKRVTA